MAHFTIVELGGDSHLSMIGTINNILNNSEGKHSFKERSIKALEEHFSSDDVHFVDSPDLFSLIPYCDVKVSVDGYKYEVRILETWIY